VKDRQDAAPPASPRPGWAIATPDAIPGLAARIEALSRDVAAAGGALVMLLPEGTELPTGRRRLPRATRIVQEPVAQPQPAAPEALLLVGLKRFDAINAAFGRATGDALLVAVEGRIGTLVAGTGAVTRADGTDFAVAPGRLDAGERLALANRIVAQIERPFMAGEHFVTLGACVGMVETRPGDSLSETMRRAAAALAVARESDIPVKLLTLADEGTAMFDAGLDTDLRRALDKGEIEVLFQPQVRMTDGAITGVEALARWQHPVHGELGAETLFAVAERSDYLTALSSHVQRRAAIKAAAWPPALSHLRLSINVTAADIARPGFAHVFLGMIDATGFPRERLTVEVTESGLIEDLDAAANLLAALRAGGCRVAIDDFGTGYSSLAYLKALPLDYLKIDKHLAQDIAGSTRDRIVVRGVIDMARSLGLSVIAEGVETEEQLALLAAEGCQYYQGFLCSRAVTGDDLAALVAARS
jgi:EAL domain-containing protein (putative c-di-GMP-specific phosphodiesterase class I)/GGDEF domain-containing protein